MAKPSAYRIQLIPYLEGKSFEGFVEIDIEVGLCINFIQILHLRQTSFILQVLSNASSIVLHQSGLTLDAPTWNLTLRDDPDSAIEIVAITYDNDIERVALDFLWPREETLDTDRVYGRFVTLSGAYSGTHHKHMLLHIKLVVISNSYNFTLGFLTEDGYGIYLDSFENAKGELSLMTTTQFEPTFARRAFPGFDEPAYKATFILSIGAEAKYFVQVRCLVII